MKATWENARVKEMESLLGKLPNAIGPAMTWHDFIKQRENVGEEMALVFSHNKIVVVYGEEDLKNLREGGDGPMPYNKMYLGVGTGLVHMILRRLVAMLLDATKEEFDE